MYRPTVGTIRVDGAVLAPDAQAPARSSVLICDEITAALDTVTQAAVLDLLAARCRGTGLAMVLITHNPAVAGRLATYVRVLAGGRLEQSLATQGVR